MFLISLQIYNMYYIYQKFKTNIYNKILVLLLFPLYLRRRLINILYNHD